MRKLNSHDLFSASRVLGTLGYKQVIQQIYNEVHKGIPQDEMGMLVIGTILDAVSSDERVEEAFFNFVSGPFEMKPQEVKELSPSDLITKLKELINGEDKETWKSFMSSLVSLMH